VEFDRSCAFQRTFCKQAVGETEELNVLGCRILLLEASAIQKFVACRYNHRRRGKVYCSKITRVEAGCLGS
jgi:hypothetical protein